MNDPSNNNLSSTPGGSEHHPTQPSDAPHAADIPDSNCGTIIAKIRVSMARISRIRMTKTRIAKIVNGNDACLINRSTREFNDNITGRNKKKIPSIGASFKFIVLVLGWLLFAWYNTLYGTITQPSRW